MKKLMTSCLLGSALALSACGGSEEQPAAEETDLTTTIPAGEATPGTSTMEGAGDTSSAAGAGTTTGAMDGGAAGADGVPPGAAEGGAADAMGGASPTTSPNPPAGGAAGNGGSPAQ